MRFGDKDTAVCDGCLEDLQRRWRDEEAEMMTDLSVREVELLEGDQWTQTYAIRVRRGEVQGTVLFVSGVPYHQRTDARELQSTSWSDAPDSLISAWAAGELPQHWVSTELLNENHGVLRELAYAAALQAIRQRRRSSNSAA